MFSREQIEQIKRESNLPELAASYGFELDHKASCRTSLVMRNTGSKIIVATGEDGHGIFFEVKGSAKSGSVIDFVMWQDSVNFGGACKVLSERINAPMLSLTPPSRKLTKPAPISRDRAGLLVGWENMQPYKPGYLEDRGLNPRTISKFAGHIRTDERGNACFRHDDENGLSGWEVKNKGFTGFAGGGNKALFSCQIGEYPEGKPPIIVITEGAIDTMSFYQLNPTEGLYISIAGNMSPEQEKLLRATLTSYPDALIITATDNDPEGERYAAIISSMREGVVRYEPPIGKDWNDALNNRTAKIAR